MPQVQAQRLPLISSLTQNWRATVTPVLIQNFGQRLAAKPNGLRPSGPTPQSTVYKAGTTRTVQRWPEVTILSVQPSGDPAKLFTL